MSGHLARIDAGSVKAEITKSIPPYFADARYRPILVLTSNSEKNRSVISRLVSEARVMEAGV
jgi:hypothetical protein